MNLNRYFNFSRFCLVVKRDLMENWKHSLRVLATLFLGCIVIYYMAFGLQNMGGPNSLRLYVGFHSSTLGLLYIWGLFIAASRFMNHMRTKEERISNLMLPATSLEKFLSRALYVTVGYMILFVVAWVLAEVAHFAILPFYDDLPEEYKICVLPEVWKQVLGSPMDNVSDVYIKVDSNHLLLGLFVGVLLSCLHSLYILGGNLFRKSAFAITFGVIALVAYVGVRVCLNVPIECCGWCEVLIGSNGKGVAAWAFKMFTFCLNVFIWWLSYKVFTRQQVVKPKFRLL